MHIVVVGVSHRTAPIHVREKLSVSEKALPEALSKLTSCECVLELCVVSTCNRTELYAVTESRDNAAVLIESFSALTGVPAEEFRAALYSYAGHKAVNHLFRVAAGLESMMLGEAQILGQVKTAYAVAEGCSCTGAILNNLFQQALAVGKRARTETGIGKGAFSVGHAAVELAGSIFGDLADRKALVIGAGKMSEITAQRILGGGAAAVTVVNRTLAKAEELAEALGGAAIGFDKLNDAIVESDVVISSTGSKEPIISRDDMLKIMRSRRERPVFLIDIASPRDFAPEVGELDNVFLYNIDDLQRLVDQNLGERQKEVEKAEIIVEQETRKFNSWLKSLEATPLIRLLREKFDSIRQGEWERYKGRLSHLSDRDRETMQAMLQSVVNKMSHYPIVQVKRYTESPNGYGKMDVVRELFGVEIADDAEDMTEAPAPPSGVDKGQK